MPVLADSNVLVAVDRVVVKDVWDYAMDSVGRCVVITAHMDVRDNVVEDVQEGVATVVKEIVKEVVAVVAPQIVEEIAKLVV